MTKERRPWMDENRFWMARGRHGRIPKFPEGEEGARQLEETVQDYFEWVEAHPLYEAKAFAYEGDVTIEQLPKMRVMTFGGLALFIGVDEKTLRAWMRERQDLRPILIAASQAIRDQKFAGAASGFFNAMIISRDLGLAEKHEHSGPEGGPIQSITSEMSPEEAAEAYARTRTDE